MMTNHESNNLNYEILPAPSILYLDEHEKFHNNDGKVFDIETRGVIEYDKIFFLARDVSTVFNMPNLHKTITDNRRNEFVINEDYKNFICQEYDSAILTTNKKIFITYEGMLKVLYCSKNGNAKLFRNWATKILFTHQIGTQKQKTELSAGLLDIPIKSLVQVLKKTAESIPCVYRFSLGKVKDLRESMNLPESMPDNYIIIKFGFCSNLSERTKQHERVYGKIKGATLELTEFVFIDPKYLSEAEVVIKNYFKSIETQVKYENYTEIMCIDTDHEIQIKEKYKYIYLKYSGCSQEMSTKINELTLEINIIKERHSYKLNDKDRIIEQKDLIISNKDLIISGKDKDIEILNLKLQLLNNT